MDKNNVLDIYDEDYAQSYNQKFLLNDWFASDVEFERDTIGKLLSEIGEDARWLDVACGTGYFLSCFPEVDRAGLDISPAMLKVAKQENPSIPFVEGDFKNKRPQWKEKWDVVSCMWEAYIYVESLPQLERVIENLAEWTSNRGVCFLPICDPQKLGNGEIKLPYLSQNLDLNEGNVRFEAVTWSWIEKNRKEHLNMLAPQVEYMVTLFTKYFEQVEVVEYPLFEGKQRKAIIARNKKQNSIPNEQKVNRELEGVMSSFLRIVRANNWWLYKLPPLLSIAYAETLLTNIPLAQSIKLTSALLFSISSLFAYGHVVNDIFDVEVDQKVGKSNAMIGRSWWQRALFCVIFVITGFVYPVTLNFGVAASVLLGINYLLPTLYSAPPFRFKEKGILGILSDAAGAHAVPTLFIATTFSHLVAEPPLQTTALAISATAWAFFAGLRGILLHQLWDRSDDLKSSVKTFVTESQVETVRFWMSRFLFPVEMLLLGSLILVISPAAPLVLVFTVFYFLLKLTLTKLDPVATFDPAPVQKAYVIPHDFYEVGLPLILATILTLKNPWFIVLLLLHIVLFYPGFERRITNLIQFIRNPSVQPPLNLTQPDPEPINNHPQPNQNEPVTSVQPANELQLTPQMQKELEDYGYVVLENFLTDTERQDLQSLVNTDPIPENAGDAATYTLFSQNDPAYRQQHSDRLKSIVSPKLTALLPNYRPAFCTWYRKSANSSTNATPLHQDPSLTTEPDTLAYGIWCPLLDVDPDNGCLHVVKGSHILNSQPRPFYTFNPFPYDDTVATLLKDRYLTPIPLKAGQAILYDKRLFHSATANPTATERVAFTCLIAPADQPTHFGYRPSPDSDTLELFAVQDDFYNRYILGDRPNGDGVNLIDTINCGYDPITPQLLAETLDPLHPESASDSRLPPNSEISPTSDQTQPAQMPAGSQLPSPQLDQLQQLQHSTARDFAQIRTELEQIQAELAQAEAARQAAQAETTQLKAFLHTQGSAVVMDYYRHAIAANPDNLQLYEQAIALHPHDAQLHLQLANRLIQQGKLDDAISRYQTAIQHCPNHFDLHLELAKALETAQRWEAAIAAYRHAIALNPQSAIVHEYLGNALAAQGQLNEASTAYRRSLQLQS